MVEFNINKDNFLEDHSRMFDISVCATSLIQGQIGIYTEGRASRRPTIIEWSSE